MRMRKEKEILCEKGRFSVKEDSEGNSRAVGVPNKSYKV